MDRDMERCVLCRHFGRYDRESGRYYCAERRRYLNGTLEECDCFVPAEKKVLR